MSVENNKAVIRRLNEEVINRGRVGVVDEVLAPGLRQPRAALGRSSQLLRPGRGWNATAAETSALESFKAAVHALRDAFPDWESVIDEQVGEGETVVTRYTVRGTQRGEYLGRPASNARVEFVETVFARFEGGKVVEFWGLGDELGFLESLGVRVGAGAGGR